MQKVIVVTGASEGLGKEISKLLLKDNKVVILSSNEEKLKLAADELNCEYRKCDVSNWKEVEGAINSIVEKYGKVDVLVNNAGLLIEGEIDQNTPEEIANVINVNVLGYMYMCKAVIPYMKKMGKGQIINICSQSGLYHRHKRAVYNPTKWAITGFTKCLQADLSAYNIRVTGVYPGKMNTKMFAKAKSTADMSDSLDSTKVAETVRFAVDSSEDMVISEIGMKSIKQVTIETICY